jgi:predicted aconitase with swiveling domain
MTKQFAGRKISPGNASGEALVTTQSLSFYGGVDPETGVVVEKDHELEGQSITGKVLIFPSGKGSTVGSYVLYQLAKTGKGPVAIINQQTETIVAVGCIIGEIPAVDRIPIDEIKTGQQLRINATKGLVEII